MKDPYLPPDPLIDKTPRKPRRCSAAETGVVGVIFSVIFLTVFPAVATGKHTRPSPQLEAVIHALPSSFEAIAAASLCVGCALALAHRAVRQVFGR